MLPPGPLVPALHQDTEEGPLLPLQPLLNAALMSASLNTSEEMTVEIVRGFSWEVLR